MIPRAPILLLALTPMMAPAQAPLQPRIEALLRETAPGTRFGLVVADETGRELIAIAPDERFIPASNTKIFTTAAAFDTFGSLDGPDTSGGAGVRLEADGRRVPDVVLVGRGDARLSSADDCQADCLATLADAVAAKTRTVRDVVGDDSLFPDERWSPGMSWNNIPTRSGTGISALTLDNNEAPLTVTPSPTGGPPSVEGAGYYAIENRALTVPGSASTIGVDRMPGSRLVRLTGTIGKDAKPEHLRLGIDDPADHTAWRFRRMLEARGVKVTGAVQVRHRPPMPADDPAIRKGAPPARPPEQPLLATLTPPPLVEDVHLTNVVSQNLHAELLLRRIGRKDGSGSIADGLAVIRAMLAKAGVPRLDYDFSDGSGMSTYNRVAPRGVVTLLRWIAAQPWGAEWRATLPVGGVDGTLAKRFRGTGLDHKLFAKTGSISAVSGLSGYLIAKSGKTLTFSAYANDIPDGESANPAMDAALEAIAAEN